MIASCKKEREAANSQHGRGLLGGQFHRQELRAGRQIEKHLSASRLTHESSDDSTLLTPKINTARAPSMTITADRALASSGAESVEFIGNVKLDRTAAGGKNAGKGPLRVRTERMLVHPDIELAEGRAAVRIEQNGSVVNAGSYRIDGRTGVSVLEGRVRATLPPSKP
ncbi:MAG: LPS export ABC transporter periplasmic protein LptC [Rhodocyclaceae bacterium]|nr:LPS export ABC transporter periplasmic protein LptC [Rhodocyclaceae bacterium]